jgi:hypothetical protein
LVAKSFGNHINGGDEFTSCKIGGYHGGDYEEWRCLGCYAATWCNIPEDIILQFTSYL